MAHDPRGLTIAFCSCVMMGGLSSFTHGSEPTDPVEDDTVRRSVQKREHTPRDSVRDAKIFERARLLMRGAGSAVYPSEFRTIDGTLNNLDNPLWGAAAVDMMRMMGNAYPISSGSIPARVDGPSARAVSNAMCASPGDLPNNKFASDYLWQWGQFLDHDLDETPIGSPPVGLDIPVPLGDPWFDPSGTGTQVIGMNRSAFEIDEHGERQHPNEITSFIDASNVYGSDDARAAALRTNDGTGRLLTSAGDLLPFNTDGFANAPTGSDPSFFLAGDVRANEQVALTAMHTLFVREHNYWVEQLSVEFPSADGEELYQRARAIVGAEMQAITFNEFLPMLLGDGAMGPYSGYDETVSPMIANMFASAAYRVGHTMLSSQIRRIAPTDLVASEGDLPLQSAFFVPSEVQDHGIDSILMGLSTQRAQSIDTYVIDDVRNFLFGAPGSGGFDLASLNIQRGRDHGLLDFNATRVAMGLESLSNFHQVSDDPGVISGLAGVYNSVNDIDPWVGLLAESSDDESMVGETLHAILVDQFSRLRTGDRYWYESYFPSEMVSMINDQTLSSIIRRNTGIGDELPDHVFVAQAPCPADINNDGVLNFFDVSGFMALFSAQDARVDYSGPDSQFNIFDISVFMSSFSAGCP